MLRLIGAVIGVLIVLTTTMSILWTLVIPRGRLGVIRQVDRVVDAAYVILSRLLGSYQRRDTFLATQAAVLLGALLICWLAAYLFGYALILWPIEHNFAFALRESGSSLFTLGFAWRPSAGSAIVDFIAAASGLIVVALQIAYLPTIYAAYNRRETEITLLAPRAGAPAWGPELLSRFTFSGVIESAGPFFESWERWSADVAESHTSYPVLLRFRSPKPLSSWLIGLLAVMDAAALFLAAAPARAPFQARLSLQMGFNCLRTLASTIGIPFDVDPLPSDPIELSYEEFLVGWERMVAVGFPLERGPEEAYEHFKGWRVNYESIAYALAYALDVVPAAWSGPRRHQAEPIRPKVILNRTPANPLEGERPRPHPR